MSRLPKVVTGADTYLVRSFISLSVPLKGFIGRSLSIVPIISLPLPSLSHTWSTNLVDIQIWLYRCASVATAVTSAGAEGLKIHMSDTSARLHTSWCG